MKGTFSTELVGPGYAMLVEINPKEIPVGETIRKPHCVGTMCTPVVKNSFSIRVLTEPLGTSLEPLLACFRIEVRRVRLPDFLVLFAVAIFFIHVPPRG